MLRRPKISFVIATYNSCKTLPLVIESVFSQCSSEVEIVVVDGASSDGTSELLRSYREKSITWISEPDQGIYDAWNKGIHVATGEWIAFLGDDDLLYNGAIGHYLSFIQKNPGLDFISSRINLKYKDGSIRVIGRPWVWAQFRRYMNVAHVGSLHHHTLFQRYGSFDADLKICGDYEFLLRPRNHLKAGFIDKILIQMTAGGISNSTAAAIWETFYIKRKLRSVSEFEAVADCAEAYLKWLFRRLVRVAVRSFPSIHSPSKSS